MQSGRDKSAGWTRAMSSASVSSSMPSSVSLHSDPPADYHRDLRSPPPFATEPKKQVRTPRVCRSRRMNSCEDRPPLAGDRVVADDQFRKAPDSRSDVGLTRSFADI